MINSISKRVLIVDDEPFNLRSLQVMIKLSLKQLKVDPDIIEPYLDKAKNGREAADLV